METIEKVKSVYKFGNDEYIDSKFEPDDSVMVKQEPRCFNCGHYTNKRKEDIFCYMFEKQFADPCKQYDKYHQKQTATISEIFTTTDLYPKCFSGAYIRLK